ncbi:phasin family protein [Microvirga thermotolerans]|uniref:Phasin domain-containing protein n=1 Tax=Microvirga thermotolerans TaxID=2651334 RepID=A0A5P9K0B6_9HYPH|nr:phasin family protein [Microvirga thermotolerans]QFU15654.1 hypothetical protein GDR74_05175 [Microvirga thermotolerans]
MAEAKKAGTPRARKQTAPKSGPELALETAQSAIESPSPASEAVNGARQADGGVAAEPMQFSRFGQEGADALRQAMGQSVLATAHGALEINDRIIAAVRDQSEAAIDLWRSALEASHPTEALRVQATGARQACEVAAAHWKDIAEATARLFHRSFEPFQTVMADRTR